MKIFVIISCGEIKPEIFIEAKSKPLYKLFCGIGSLLNFSPGIFELKQDIEL